MVCAGISICAGTHLVGHHGNGSLVRDTGSLGLGSTLPNAEWFAAKACQAATRERWTMVEGQAKAGKGDGTQCRHTEA